jgi:hypothetical protein
MPAVSLNRSPLRARGVALSVKVFLLGGFWFAPFFFSLCRLWSLLFLVWSQRLLSETRAFLGSLGLSFYRWEGLLPHTVIYAMSIPRDSNERSHLLFGF